MQNFGRVAVSMGGLSSERDASLDSGATIATALKGGGMGAHAFNPEETPLTDLKTRRSQTVSNILYGTYGEDGAARGTLELFGTSYTGGGMAASAVGMGKCHCKLIWQAPGLPISEFTVLREDTDFKAAEKRLGLPMSVKSANEDSSVGVVRAKEKSRLKDVYAELKHMKGEIIAECFIGGGEYSCPVLGGRGLPSILIVSATELYDYEAKYDRNGTVYRCPSDLNAADEGLMRELAVRGAEAIGVKGCVHADFLKDLGGKLYLLEINTLLGMTSHNLVPKPAVQIGMDSPGLCIEVLKAAHVG